MSAIPGLFGNTAATASGSVATDTAPLLNATTVQGQLNQLKRNQVIHLRGVVRASVQGTVNQITNAGQYGYVSATPDVIVLPDNAKCIPTATSTNGLAGSSEQPWARAGTGTLGPLTFGLTGNPTALQCTPSPSGDLLVNAASAWTLLDVNYKPQFQDIIDNTTYVCTAGTGVVTLSGGAAVTGALIMILEAEVLVGGVTGKCIIVPQQATAPTTGQACLNLGKTGIFFCIADAATSVRLKLGVVPALNY